MARATRLVLASSSPRRMEVLSRSGLRFDVVRPGIDEVPPVPMPPIRYVQWAAEAKARAVAKRVRNALVVGADTEVVLDGKVFGKPIEAAYEVDDLKAAVGNAKSRYQLIESASSRSSVESFRDESSPLAGTMGLDRAVKDGALRPAGEADLKKIPDFLRSLAKVRGSRVYVILKELILPPGLHGDSTVVFILEKGVALPQGALGESALLDLNNRTCLGRCSDE